MKRLTIWFLCCLPLLASFDAIERFEADFTQSVKSTEGKEIVYTGRLYAKTPFFVYWRYETPVQKEIFIQSNEMVVYEPELEQATFSALRESIDFLTVLKKADKVEEGLFKATFDETDYFLRAEGDAPRHVFFRDRLENSVDIAFDSIVINGDMDDSVFTFIPPEDVDLIRR